MTKYVRILLNDKLGGGVDYQFNSLKNDANKIGLTAELIETNTDVYRCHNCDKYYVESDEGADGTTCLKNCGDEYLKYLNENIKKGEN